MSQDNEERCYLPVLTPLPHLGSSGIGSHSKNIFVKQLCPAKCWEEIDKKKKCGRCLWGS